MASIYYRGIVAQMKKAPGHHGSDGLGALTPDSPRVCGLLGGDCLLRGFAARQLLPWHNLGLHGLLCPACHDPVRAVVWLAVGGRDEHRVLGLHGRQDHADHEELPPFVPLIFVRAANGKPRPLGAHDVRV